MRNDGGNAKHWIAVELKGVRAQRNGVGAVVTVTARKGARPLVAEVSASSTYIAQDGSARLHFGLGDQTDKVRSVQIEWPSGRVQTVKKLAIDEVHAIAEDTVCRGKARKQDTFCVKAAVDRKCIVAMNDGGARVAVATGKQLVSCVGRPGASAEACTAGDPKGTIAKAEAKAAALALKHCAQDPSFGPTSAAAVSEASGKLVRLRDVFGPNLDAALIRPSADRKGAACQLAVARGLTQLGLTQLLAFDRCKARGLARGQIASTETLAACYSATGDKGVTALAARLGKRAARKCGGVSIAAAFPGQCTGSSASDLFTCVLRAVDVRRLPGAERRRRPRAGLPPLRRRRRDVVLRRRPVATHSIARAVGRGAPGRHPLDCRARPCTRATSSTSRSRCGTRGRAYGGGGSAWLTDERHASDDPDARPRDRDQLRRLPRARARASRARAATRRVRQLRDAHGRARLRRRLHHDRGRHARGGRQPHRRGGDRLRARPTARTRQGNYADPTYTPVNEPLIVKQPGTTSWPTRTAGSRSRSTSSSRQNGIPLPGNVQVAIGSRWRDVKPFALTPPADPGDVYIDPGPAAAARRRSGDDAGYKDGARRASIELSSQLDADRRRD